MQGVFRHSPLGLLSPLPVLCDSFPFFMPRGIMAAYSFASLVSLAPTHHTHAYTHTHTGAGKTTFLNTLAGRIGPAGTLTGAILVNGAPRRHSIWRSQCAYVEQDDLLYPNLSVYETIKFAALLRLPSSMSNETKLQRVDEVIMELGLNGCRNTRIGSPDQRGISGGERKRVSIAIELVSQPSILFLDEVGGAALLAVWICSFPFIPAGA
jgi:ABC-type transport system involved in cytochrome bd biosynthesis fused ATPase/permease subunit